MQGSVKIEIDVGKADFSKASQDVQKFARDTGKALDPIKNQKLEMNVADATIKMQQLKQQLKDFQGTLSQKKQLIIDTNNAQSNLTEAKRQLQNFKNTGDETTSRLQSKFNQLGQSVSNVFARAGTALASLGVMTFFKSVVNEAVEAQRQVAQMNAVIKSTGGAAGLTGTEIQKMNTELGKMSGLDNDVVASASNMLLTFTNIKGDTFQPATQAVLDLATAMNGGLTPASEELAKTSIQVGKALNDPIKGMTALRKVGVAFDETQMKQIKNFQETGQLAKAQAMILAELNKEFGGSAAAQLETYGGKMQAMNIQISEMKEALGNALIPVLSKIIGFFQPVIAQVQTFIEENPRLSQALSITTIAVVALSTAIAFLGGPITLIIAGFVAIAGMGIGVVNSFNEMTDTISKYRDGLIDADGNLTELGKQFQETERKAKEHELAIKANNASIQAFKRLNISQTGTRAEFEATRKKAIEGANANIALAKSYIAVAQASKAKMGNIGKVPGLNNNIGISFGMGGNADDKIIESQQNMIDQNTKDLETAINSVFTGAGNTGGSGGGGGGVSKLEKQVKDSMTNLDAKIKDSETKWKGYQDEVDKTKQKIKELRDSATKDIEDINRQLKDLSNSGSDQLAKRYAEIVNEINTNTGMDSTERNKLEEERLFIEGKVTKELLDQAVAYSQLSEGQKIFKDNSQEIATLTEKQNVATAFLGGKLKTTATGGIGIQDENDPTKIVAITNLKNQQYALDLINKQQAYDLDLQAQQTKADSELAIYTKLNEDKLALDQQYTKLFGDEVNKQVALVNTLIAKMKELANAKGGAGANYGSTTNNSSTQNNTINVNNNVDVKAVTNVLTKTTR